MLIATAIHAQDVQLAADGTRKLVSVLTSGEGAGKKVETVIIPMLRYATRRASASRFFFVYDARG